MVMSEVSVRPLRKKPAMKKTGPFYDFTKGQWAAVRETHRRFCKMKNLGRPLMTVCPAVVGPDHELPTEEMVLAGPSKRQHELDEAIIGRIRVNRALCAIEKRLDTFPLLYISRDFYGHSQRLAEPFGTTTVIKGDGHAQAHPSIHSLSEVASLKLRSTKDCRYLSRGREVMHYFHESTEGRYHIPNMVTTGPCDTVNYATGSTQLLLGFYENPKAVHQLLRMATDIIIEDILACRKLTGDRLISDHTYLLDGCFCICSEIRSQFSAEHYEEFKRHT